MLKIKLDERLAACAEYVRENSRLADVGTDHAYLPTYLCMIDKIPSAIACDINKLPLEKAEQTVSAHNLCERIELRLCDGLSKIGKDEADDIVIAGMGGELIVSILQNAPFLKNEKYRLILQPMSKAYELRKYLSENGFKICDEKAAFAADKIYTVICAEYKNDAQEADDLFYYVGLLNDKTDDNSLLYKQKIKKAIIKKANGILTSDCNNKKAKELLITAERIKV